MIAITLTQFILASLFGAAVLVTIGMLVIIRQHRNKDEKKKSKWDDTDKIYFQEDDYGFKKKIR